MTYPTLFVAKFEGAFSYRLLQVNNLLWQAKQDSQIYILKHIWIDIRAAIVALVWDWRYLTLSLTPCQR